MTTPPVGPSSSPQQPGQTTPGTQGTTPPAGSTPPVAQTTSFEDPTGVWSEFLSTGGNQATPEQVHMFLNSLLQFFAKVILAQSDASAKRASQTLKDSIQGN